ncbi:MAG: HlyD family efflux transporter periplasmic adaptor subunit [Pirellulaceae bacterium]|jgi:multidrug resistance efflux pump|nr:HlyD family efflux transporter periplasmic adaptor subunit [Pirellulaceae bacterium]
MRSTISLEQIRHIPLPAMDLVRSSQRIRKFARILLAALGLWAIGMLLLPWQQTSRGTGKVIAYTPQERQQTVISPVDGIVFEIMAGLREGDKVKQGDVILELVPIAADLQNQIKSQVREYEAKLGAIAIKESVYGQNAIDFEAARDYAVQAAREMVSSANAKLSAKKKLIPGYEAKLHQANLNYDRFQSLEKGGFRAEREVEELKRNVDVAQADLESAREDVSSAEYEVKSKEQELEQKRREFQTKVDVARAYQQEAVSEAASVRKDIRDLEIKLQELQQLKITAPRDGSVFRLPLFERGQTVKKGDSLFTIVPETTDLAVELWVTGLDIPLIQPNDHVRLQFEGWPAVQFSGWPSVAVGTFGGKVIAIDDSDDGEGKFRIQVVPENDSEWPPPHYLRQGVRANGWVMLQQVTLGYELWRLTNGFPPARPDADPKKLKASAPPVKVN